MSTIKLKRIKQAVDTGVTQPLSIGGVASDNSDEVMNIASNGDLQFKKIIQTNGIKFPATQVPSADHNTLDDYEEGTFTPVVYGSTTAGVGTYASQVGKYTKVGNLVTISCVVVLTNHTGTGNMRISGLPFSPNMTFALTNNSYNISHTAGAVLNAAINAGQPFIVFDVISTTNSAYIGEPTIVTSGIVSISGSYLT